jgi:hypothetical protein
VPQQQPDPYQAGGSQQQPDPHNARGSGYVQSLEHDFLSQHQYGGLEQQILGYPPPMGMSEGMCNPQPFYFLPAR